MFTYPKITVVFSTYFANIEVLNIPVERGRKTKHDCIKILFWPKWRLRSLSLKSIFVPMSDL